MKTQELLQALKEKTWLSLTHEVTKDMAIYQAFNPLGERVLTTLEETGSDNREYTLGTSHGTHVDAPAHFMAGESSYRTFRRRSVTCLCTSSTWKTR